MNGWQPLTSGCHLICYAPAQAAGFFSQTARTSGETDSN